jgi:hypothetical protein
MIASNSLVKIIRMLTHVHRHCITIEPKRMFSNVSMRIGNVSMRIDFSTLIKHFLPLSNKYFHTIKSNLTKYRSTVNNHGMDTMLSSSSHCSCSIDILFVSHVSSSSISSDVQRKISTSQVFSVQYRERFFELIECKSFSNVTHCVASDRQDARCSSACDRRVTSSFSYKHSESYSESMDMSIAIHQRSSCQLFRLNYSMYIIMD